MEVSLGKLTTHILDTSNGVPARGVAISLFWRGEQGDAEATLISTHTTNHDGRCDGPLLDGDAFKKGVYELIFEIGAYFEAKGAKTPTTPFLDDVIVRFGISDSDEHYHVPLLVSPYGYSTYRGS